MRFLLALLLFSFVAAPRLSRKTGLAMAFKLMMSAQKRWRKLDGQNRLPEIIQGIEFRDGLRQLQPAA